MEDRWIKECLRQAKRAFDVGEVPVGAVVVKDGKVIAKAHNKVESLRDPTAHAELLAIKKGRANLHEMGPHFRTCDLMLRERGIKFFPVSLGPMRLLTERGIRLKTVMEGWGKVVYEVFPGAFYDVMGVGRKDKKAILELYRRLGFNLEERKYTKDEIDAIACLLTGIMFLERRAELLAGEDGAIIIPKAI
jgi:predicted nuclease with RNAse H fold